ncbi:hypothetical protein ACIBKY_46225 [Nonomuraea sp. NPDC050394]|uniref:hypothetical protein n=1 Tax=Nonomuraea sp. NPDC050394 TaxID=3364363 RepID=UPI0037A3CDF5
MTSAEFIVARVNVRSAGTSWEDVADRVVTLLDSGAVSVVDFAGDEEPAVIRAIGIPAAGEHDGR